MTYEVLQQAVDATERTGLRIEPNKLLVEGLNSVYLADQRYGGTRCVCGFFAFFFIFFYQ